MKKMKFLVALMLFATTATFSTVSFAEVVNEDQENEVLPDWYWSAPDRIDTENPDLDNLSPAKAIISLGTSTKEIKPIIAGEGHTYLNKDGLKWNGTNATTVDEVVMNFSVIGSLYRQDKGSTKLVRLDIEQDSKSYGKGIVIASTEGNTGVVGSTMVSEGVHYVDLGLIHSTVITNEKAVVK